MSAKELLAKLTGIVSLLPPKYVDALLFLHERWDRTGANWTIYGTLAECLRTVNVAPDCIEVVCSKDDAYKLYEAATDLTTQLVQLQLTKLPDAIHEGTQYPVYARSHYFEFEAKGIKVRVYGDLQFRVADWEWGDIFEVRPEYVSVVGKLTAVTPLSVLLELYSDLGWAQDAQRIQRVLQRRRCH